MESYERRNQRINIKFHITEAIKMTITYDDFLKNVDTDNFEFDEV